jgi:hypothetical protein
MKNLVNKVITESTMFMGEEVQVKKMSVAEVFKVQKLADKHGKAKNKEEGQMALLRDVLRLSVIGADELTDEEFNSFPVAELTELSDKVMSLSGLGAGAAEVGN